MSVTFDTNILIYAADKRDLRKQGIARRTIREAVDAVVLWQVACEFIAASRKLGPHGFTPEEAWDQLSHYLSVFPLVRPDTSVLKYARRLQTEHRHSFWDAMILAACHESGASRLYSEDPPGGAGPEGLEIVNPFV